ncbi:hypothetical protein D3C84_1079300 [compost metagenome]
MAVFLGVILGFALGITVGLDVNAGLGASVAVGCTEDEGVDVGNTIRIFFFEPASSVISRDSTRSLLASLDVWVTSDWLCWAEL